MFGDKWEAGETDYETSKEKIKTNDKRLQNQGRSLIVTCRRSSKIRITKRHRQH